MKKDDDPSLREIKNLIAKEVKIAKEVVSIFNGIKQAENQQLKAMALSQINSLRTSLKKTVDEISGILEDMSVTKPLPKTQIEITTKSIPPPVIMTKDQKQEQNIYEEKEKTTKHKIIDVDLTELDKKTIKRLKRKKEVELKQKTKKANKYVSFANNIFGEYSQKLSKTPMFMTLNRDLIKANMKFVISSYISITFLTCIIALIAGFLLFLFFMFFNIGTALPIITKVTGSLFSRFLNVFWIIFISPLAVFLGMYLYPSVEKNYIENRINQELPFATIHMSAIAGSMIEPSKIFSIIISTKEYPFIEKEFTKLINQINVYGYDLVSALRTVAFNSPSIKLTELLNGIATTISSGGGLPEFFEKRSQTLLFEYQIDREKNTKTAETFMDIYISLVIAAPMILMLLLMMMRVSGLGVSLSTSMITLVMILGVSMINIIFSVFLQLKQPPS